MDLSEFANFIHYKKSYTKGIKQSRLRDKILKFLKDEKYNLRYTYQCLI